MVVSHDDLLKTGSYPYGFHIFYTANLPFFRPVGLSLLSSILTVLAAATILAGVG